MSGAFLYSGKSVEIDGVYWDVPEFTEFEEKCQCLNCHLTYIPAIKKYFVNQWEVTLLYPSIIIVLLLLTYIFGFWSTYYTCNTAGFITMLVLGLIIFVCWAFAYFESMFSSPGFLPWYWAVERREDYTFEEQMAGIITNQDQYEFAQNFDRPERATLSRQARRIVLRADHICKWIGNWVGLKNYRAFFTQLVWFMVSFLYFFVVIILEIVSMARFGWVTTAPRIALIILFIPVILFFIFFMIVFVRHIRYLITNNTTINDLKCEREGVYTNPYDIGCFDNMEQTLGNRKYCALWFCPVPLPRMNDGFTWVRNDQETPEADQPVDVEKAPAYEESSEDSPVPLQSSSSSSAPLLLSDSSPEISSESESDTKPKMQKNFVPPPPLPKPGEAPKPTSFDAPPEGVIVNSSQNTKVTKSEKVSSQEKGKQLPIPKAVEVDEDFDSGEGAAEPKKYDSEREHTNTFLDALLDRTIDSSDDEDLHAYTKGQKAGANVSREPKELRIKDIDPEREHRPGRHRVRRRVKKVDAKRESGSPHREGHAHYKMEGDKLKKRVRKTTTVMRAPDHPPVPRDDIEQPRLPVFRSTRQIDVDEKDEPIRFFIPK